MICQFDRVLDVANYFRFHPMFRIEPPLPPLPLSVFLVLLFGVSICPISAIAQTVDLPNSDFENGLDGWQAFVKPYCEIELSDEAFEGNNACEVCDREFFWTGISRNLMGVLQRDTDYRISVRVKSDEDLPTRLKLEVRQNDDRGIRYVQLGIIDALPDSWLLLEGGFNLQINGELSELDLKIGGDVNHTGDFLIDDLKIEINNWRETANQRIEEIRKSDLELSIESVDGAPLANHSINIRQTRNQFAFGSTMNEAILDNPRYQQFFAENFDWATIEWYSQWYPVEFMRDFEDYSIADATLEFCEQNSIPLRGHAIAWPAPQFVPPWLSGLDDSEVAQELDERIENVVSRYSGKFASWDVCNEMLSESFFQDRLGPSIRGHIFRRARLFDSFVPLFTNEYNIVNLHEAKRINAYKSLVQQLQTESADIGGIGIQGHFDGNVSPTTIRLAIDELSTLNLPIWISEYDSVNNDPVELAKNLETCYRYAFSRPEIDGITMWGFWAGAHWRGEDAAIVNLDWSLNAAGEKFLQLRDEWSTEYTGTSDENSVVSLRGFHGSYLATIPHPETSEPTFHAFHLSPSTSGQSLKLVVSEPNSLTVYGNESIDDLFSVNLSDQISSVSINGQIVPLNDIEFQSVLISGGGGNDELKINGYKNQSSRYGLNRNGLDYGTTENRRISFSKIENITVESFRPDDTIDLYQSGGFDIYLSEPSRATMVTPNTELCAINFSRTFGRSTQDAGDLAYFFDSPLKDVVRVNSSRLYVIDGPNLSRRFATGFSNYQMESTAGADFAIISSLSAENEILMAPNQIDGMLDSARFCFNAFPTARWYSLESTDVLNINDSEIGDDYIYFRPGLLIFRSATSTYQTYNCQNILATLSSSGNDRVRLIDGPGDDLLNVVGNTAIFSDSDSNSFSVTSPDRLFPTGTQGGINQAVIAETEIRISFSGDWVFPKDLQLNAPPNERGLTGSSNPTPQFKPANK